MSVGRNSRHNHGAIIRTEGANGLLEPDHLDIRPRVTLRNLSGVGEVQVTESDTFASLAHRRLGDSKLWWVIADVSDVVDPVRELHPEPEEVFITQLAEDWEDASAPAVFRDVRKVELGQTLFLENLLDETRVEVTVLARDPETSAVSLRVLSGDLPVAAVASRVVLRRERAASLLVPSFDKTQMGPLDFGNRIQTLEEL